LVGADGRSAVFIHAGNPGDSSTGNGPRNDRKLNNNDPSPVWNPTSHIPFGISAPSNQATPQRSPKNRPPPLRPQADSRLEEPSSVQGSRSPSPPSCTFKEALDAIILEKLRRFPRQRTEVGADALEACTRGSPVNNALIALESSTSVQDSRTEKSSGDSRDGIETGPESSRTLSNEVPDSPSASLTEGAQAKEQVVCQLCGQTFDSKDAFLEHSNLKHKEQISKTWHPCKSCGKLYPSKKSLRSHGCQRRSAVSGLVNVCF